MGRRSKETRGNSRKQETGETKKETMQENYLFEAINISLTLYVQ
jgi:hypothetical protein